MKVLTKIIILASVALPVGASATVAGVKMYQNNNIVSNNIDMDGDYYVMSNDDYTFRLNSTDLKFTITKGSVTWNSGEIKEEDREEITSLREAFLTSPVTIYSYNSSGGESSFSLFDTNHPVSPRIITKNNKITAKVAVTDGRKTDPTLKLSFSINYALTSDGLDISITDIEEGEGKNTLSKMVIYPGFSMSHKLVDGYFLIPDGSGAIVDLSTPTHGQSAIQLRTYGNDIGISASSRNYYSPEQLSMPMYAICDNEKAVMATVESGQEYSELNSKVAGMIDDYNCSYFRFIFKDTTYQYMGISETNRKAVPQNTTNQFEPAIRYHLYDEKLEYYDIAKKYRSYLLDNHLLDGTQKQDVSLKLEFLMSENKKALFGKEVFNMTSPNYIKNKIKDLLTVGSDLSVSLRGYSSNGYGGSYPYSFPVSSSSDYKSLGKYLSDNDIDLSYTVDVVRSFSKEHGDKLAMNMSQKLITSSDYVNGTSSNFYRLNPKETTSLITSYSQKVKSNHANGMDFTSIGFELFSTYYHEENTRTTSSEKYTQSVKDLDVNVNMRKPNLYMFPYFTNYLDAPTSSSGYMMETASIPFLSMVLSGYKTFYSSPINLNYLGEKQLLEMVDYNICPSFLLTEKDTTKLIDSPTSSYIYSSVYDIWESDIINSYHKVVNALKQVEGSAFVKREQISNKVFKNTYDNGKYIIINYSNDPITVSDREVKGLSSEVFEG